jgi:hypothetical protein
VSEVAVAATHDIIGKAKKLMALRDHAGTPGESEAAANALNKLLDKHRLSVAELENASGEKEECIVDQGDPILEWKRLSPHMRDLCAVLCSHYGVAWWQRRRRDGVNTRGAQRWRRAVHMCGRPSDVEIVRYMFAWIAVEMNLLGAKYPGGRIARSSFKLGFVAGIERQLKLSRQEAVGERGMVLRDRLKDAELALAKLFPEMKTAAMPNPNIDPSAYLHGSEYGKAMHLGGRVGDSKKRAPALLKGNRHD